MKTIIGCIMFSTVLFACNGRRHEILNVVQFEKKIRQSDVQLLDVRTPAEYAQGYIGHAVNLDVEHDSLFNEKFAQFDKSKPVFIYCRSGRRSKIAAEKLVHSGYKLYSLDHGILGWQQEGRALTKP